MFEINAKILGLSNGVSKKTGNPWHIAMIRVGTHVLNLRISEKCEDITKFIDKEVSVKVSLTAYQLNPNLTIESVSLVK